MAQASLLAGIESGELPHKIISRVRGGPAGTPLPALQSLGPPLQGDLLGTLGDFSWEYNPAY